MIVIENNQVYSTEGKYVHRIGTETYVKRSTILPTDTIMDFEEVDELPKYTEQEYKEKVQELIALRYSISDEIALINNARDKSEKHIAELDEYMAYREECKIKAKEILANEAKEILSNE